MNYKDLLEKSEKELADLKTQRAVVSEKINELVEKLNLDSEGDIISQVQSLKDKLKAESEELNKQLEDAIKKLEELDE